jgi:hypothetical protein
MLDKHDVEIPMGYTRCFNKLMRLNLYKIVYLFIRLHQHCPFKITSLGCNTFGPTNFPRLIAGLEVTFCQGLDGVGYSLPNAVKCLKMVTLDLRFQFLEQVKITR